MGRQSRQDNLPRPPRKPPRPPRSPRPPRGLKPADGHTAKKRGVNKRSVHRAGRALPPQPPPKQPQLALTLLSQQRRRCQCQKKVRPPNSSPPSRFYQAAWSLDTTSPRASPRAPGQDVQQRTRLALGAPEVRNEGGEIEGARKGFWEMEFL